MSLLSQYRLQFHDKLDRAITTLDCILLLCEYQWSKQVIILYLLQVNRCDMCKISSWLNQNLSKMNFHEISILSSYTNIEMDPSSLVCTMCWYLVLVVLVIYTWESLSTITSLTHWGRVTHICVSDLTIIGSDNGLSPGRRQAIIWTNAGILLIGPSGTNLSEILIFVVISFEQLTSVELTRGFAFCSDKG